MSDFDGQVGISEDLSIPVNATVYRGGATMVLIAGVLLLLLTVGAAVFYLYQNAALTPLPSSVPVPRTPVLEAYCQECGNGTYRTDTRTCVCRPAFSGANCNVERVNASYFDVGSPAGHSPIDAQVLSTPVVNALSRGNNSCTQACDAEPLCAAVRYSTAGPCQSQPACSLLAAVRVPSNAFLVRSGDSQSQLYIKDPLKTVFDNRVIVAADVAAFPPNYPKVYAAPGYSQHLLNRVFHVDFFPEVAVAPAGYVGVYSLAPFAMADIPTFSGKSDVFFVIGNPLLPQSWRGRRIFVAYAPKATVPI